LATTPEKVFDQIFVIVICGTLLKAALLASPIFISEIALGVGLNFASGFRFSTFVTLITSLRLDMPFLLPDAFETILVNALDLLALIILPGLDSFLFMPASREIFFSTVRFIFSLLGNFDRFATAFPFFTNFN
jgi:hypothetical protein